MDLVAYLKLVRLPLVFTAAADGAAGYLVLRSQLPAGEDGIAASGLLGAAGASACLYLFGMGMNDVADRRKDATGAPSRPIPAGRVGVRGAVTVCLVLLGASLLSLLAPDGGPRGARLLIWGALVLSILAYDFFLKSSATMGLVRALDLLLGMSLAGALTGEGFDAVREADGAWTFPWRSAGLLCLPAFVYVTALTDVSALEDAPVRRDRLYRGLLLMVAGSFLPLVVLRGRHPEAALYSLVLSAWLCRRAVGARDPKGVMLLVRDGVGGIILLNAALLAAAGAGALSLGVAALVLPAALSVKVFKRLA
jgi:4-hydroxybenzoate polyprenyltransferase